MSNTIKEKHIESKTPKKIKTGKDMRFLFGIWKDRDIDSTKVREEAWTRKS